MRIKSLVQGLSALLVTLLGAVAVAQRSTASYTQVVNKATGTITIVSSVNPSGYTQPVTFTATVPSAATGTVTFFDGSTQVGAAVTVATGAAAATSANRMRISERRWTYGKSTEVGKCAIQAQSANRFPSGTVNRRAAGGSEASCGISQCSRRG